jgi:hypothetical protein
MAKHSRSKNGVVSLAYVPAIQVFAEKRKKTWMPATSVGLTVGRSVFRVTVSARAP